MTIKVSPGPPGTPDSRWYAQRLQELRHDELARIRRQAEQWRAGLAGFVTVILTASLLSGRSTVSGLSLDSRIAVGLLMLGSVSSAVTAVFLSTHAAHGLVAGRTGRPTMAELVLEDRITARQSARDLRAAVLLTAASLFLLIGAIALVWFAP
jgi:hypothetical protein